MGKGKGKENETRKKPNKKEIMEEIIMKSKKEVMEEIIMKSKLGKMEKAKQKEEKEKLLDELNKNFTSLVDSQSQKERQLKLAKKSKYNLSDGEEDTYEDGALGGSSGKDDFDSGLLSDEDLQVDDLEDAESKRLKHLNRNRSLGSSGEEERHKSKKEIMEEIIMKSKLGRMEKAKHKEEKEKLLDELNKNFTSLKKDL